MTDNEAMAVAAIFRPVFFRGEATDACRVLNAACETHQFRVRARKYVMSREVYVIEPMPVNVTTPA